LGLDIEKGLKNFDIAFKKIFEKIKNIICFWERFYLTLPGRLAVMKTLIIPQLNYLGCFVQPSDEIITKIQGVIDKFVVKNMNISTVRRYLPPESGGLGIFELKTFLLAQRCSWIKRAHDLPIDNWRFDLRRLSPTGQVHSIRLCDINKEANPILYNIVDAYTSFVGEFSKVNNNYMVASICDNPAFARGPIENRLLDANFFGRDIYYRNRTKLRSLTYSDCFNNGVFKQLNEFHQESIMINRNIWMRLRAALTYAKNKYHEENPKVANPMTVESFLSSFKKGSKKFRTILEQQSINNVEISSLNSVVSFSSITGTNIPSNEDLACILGSWNLSFMQNHLREFIYQCRNNLLKVGARVAHFQPQFDSRCFFCRSLLNDTLVKETFDHIFFTCPVTTRMLMSILTKLEAKIDIQSDNFLQAYWYGIVEDKVNQSLQIFYDTFRHSVWKFKLRRTVPTVASFHCIFFSQVRLTTWVKPTLRDDFSQHFNRDLFLQALG
jgi:hypothetical protein